MAGWAGCVRDAARASGWSARQGHIVRLEQGIVSLVYDFAGAMRFYAFPEIWNLTLWRLLESPTTPLTRHATTMTLPTPLLATRPLYRGLPDEAAVHMVAFAETTRKALVGEWLRDLLAQKARAVRIDRPDDYTITEMIWHLCEGRSGDARRIAADVIAGKRRASVVISGRDRRTIFERVVALSESEVP